MLFDHTVSVPLDDFLMLLEFVHFIWFFRLSFSWSPVQLLVQAFLTEVWWYCLDAIEPLSLNIKNSLVTSHIPFQSEDNSTGFVLALDSCLKCSCSCNICIWAHKFWLNLCWILASEVLVSGFWCRLYFARISIGTPPKDYYVQVDTGSDILWVNCAGCTKCPAKSDLGVCAFSLASKTRNPEMWYTANCLEFCIKSLSINPLCYR